MMPTDRELMLAVRDGDVERFGVLFDRYHQRLYEFFYRLGSNAASSQDLSFQGMGNLRQGTKEPGRQS